jgi:hypothetical protein
VTEPSQCEEIPAYEVSDEGFEVLTAIRIKMVVFWVVAPCSLLAVRRHTFLTFSLTEEYFEVKKINYELKVLQGKQQPTQTQNQSNQKF